MSLLEGEHERLEKTRQGPGGLGQWRAVRVGEQKNSHTLTPSTFPHVTSFIRPTQQPLLRRSRSRPDPDTNAREELPCPIAPMIASLLPPTLFNPCHQLIMQNAGLRCLSPLCREGGSPLLLAGPVSASPAERRKDRLSRPSISLFFLSSSASHWSCGVVIGIERGRGAGWEGGHREEIGPRRHQGACRCLSRGPMTPRS